MIDMPAAAGLNMEDDDYQDLLCLKNYIELFLIDSCVDETKKILNRYFVLVNVLVYYSLKLGKT